MHRPSQDDDAVGALLDAALLSCLPSIADLDLQAYVAAVGNRVAVQASVADRRWTFRLIDDHRPLAFALPGSFVYVALGLLLRVQSEAELAAVLAHEMGHALAGHGHTALAAVFEGGGMFKSLDIEVEADAIAFRLLAHGGYGTDALPQVLRELAVLMPGAREELGRRVQRLEQMVAPPRTSHSPDRLLDSLDGAVLRAPGVSMIGLRGWGAQAEAGSPCDPLVVYNAAGSRVSISSRSRERPPLLGEAITAPEGYALYLRPDPRDDAVVAHAAMRGPAGAWREITYEGAPDATMAEATATLRSMWAPAPGSRARVIRAREGDTVAALHAAHCPLADLAWMQSVSGVGAGETLHPGDSVLCTDAFETATPPGANLDPTPSLSHQTILRTDAEPQLVGYNTPSSHEGTKPHTRLALQASPPQGPLGWSQLAGPHVVGYSSPSICPYLIK